MISVFLVSVRLDDGNAATAFLMREAFRNRIETENNMSWMYVDSDIEIELVTCQTFEFFLEKATSVFKKQGKMEVKNFKNKTEKLF
jgi:Na+/H+ antiporter NhaB